MYKYIKSSKEQINIEWTIEIYVDDVTQKIAASYLDEQDPAYQIFIDSIITTLESMDYLLNDKYANIDNGDISRYYEFCHMTEDLDVTVLLLVRLSNHQLPPKFGKSGEQRQDAWLRNQRAKEIKKDFKQEMVPLVMPVRILFKENPKKVNEFDNYKDALAYFHMLINTVLPQ